MDHIYDVLIVGSGAAGLYCALNLPENYDVLIITKDEADNSDSFLAQGGMCMLRGEEDYDNYFEDTMKAGHFENDERTVEVMIRSSNSIVRDLIRYGVQFEHDSKGNLAFTKEGAHSNARIVFHEDITGKEITSTLYARVKERSNIKILEHTTMLDVIAKDNICYGVVACDQDKNVFTIAAEDVVLACGGIGGLFKNSTNFAHITGDALAIAMKHNVKVEHLDYIQIHPTTLFSKKKGRRFLISESVRGEGAVLLNKAGERFTDELQPRDVVSAAIWKQMEEDGTEYVYEDLRPIGEEEILKHFPNIYKHCLEEGYDVLKEPIPVVPAQHYFMGGISVNLSGETTMKDLYAVGETCWNGVHGKNRLASNSLLESLVFSQRAADDILYGSKTEKSNIPEVDLNEYKDVDGLLKDYHVTVRNEIERMKASHE